MLGEGSARLPRKIARALERNPWIGPARYVEPVRLHGAIVWLGVSLLLFEGIFRVLSTQTPGLTTYFAFDITMVVIVGGLIWFLRRLRLVVCAHGVLLGPRFGKVVFTALPFEAIRLQSLTRVRRFWLLGAMGLVMLQNGSSKAWTSWGIVFRADWCQEWDKTGQVVYQGDLFDLSDLVASFETQVAQRGEPSDPEERRQLEELRALVAGLEAERPPMFDGVNMDSGVFPFPLRREFSPLVEQLVLAAAEYGYPGARSMPVLDELPVALTGRKRDLGRLLPRVFGAS